MHHDARPNALGASSFFLVGPTTSYDLSNNSESVSVRRQVPIQVSRRRGGERGTARLE